LGSTGIGGGIAIPHGRMSALTKPCGLFARLAQPVDFDSIDERPVDIVFLLVAPEGAGADHLKALARVSRLLRDRALVDNLRATENADALYALLVETVQAQSAA
jgi:PTS system nitrogen regulatory IIA component